LRQDRNLISAAGPRGQVAVREQLFAWMQTGLPYGPIDFVVKPVREINLLRLLRLDHVRVSVVEARVMPGYDGIMHGGLAQLFRRQYPSRDD
jgi:hypothetical protein